MRFKPYSDILDTWDIKELLFAAGDLDWIVQEKVKGTQFSLWNFRGKIAGANRHRFLGTDELFFNWKGIRDKLAPRLEKVRKHIKAQEIVVYGEMFGGVYPGIDAPNVQTLNRGVYYAPFNAWWPHDIVIDGMWQPQWYIYQLLEELDLSWYAYQLYKGRLKRALAFSENFQSEIHTFFHLPKLDNNPASGIVIRPVEPVFLEGGKRAILKKERLSR